MCKSLELGVTVTMASCRVVRFCRGFGLALALALAFDWERERASERAQCDYPVSALALACRNFKKLRRERREKT